MPTDPVEVKMIKEGRGGAGEAGVAIV